MPFSDFEFDALLELDIEASVGVVVRGGRYLTTQLTLELVPPSLDASFVEAEPLGKFRCSEFLKETNEVVIVDRFQFTCFQQFLIPPD